LFHKLPVGNKELLQLFWGNFLGRFHVSQMVKPPSAVKIAPVV
jgi:hypothetical protein